MSMQNWLSDAQSFPNHENGSFNPNGDPSLAFMQTQPSSTFDFNHMQNPQLQQQHMQNGAVRNGSPAYNNPLYQTQSMIPSKRPRPREDSIGASPQQNPGALPASRSQTPQGPYPGLQGAVNGGQQYPGSALYQQYQQPSNHASPSPVVQNQTFNPQAPHQRVQTMSPSPFSPATQSFAQQASPPQSENGSRVNTPQNGGSHYPQGMPYGGTQNQPFTPPVGPQANGAGLSQYNQHLQAQHHQSQLRMNEMRMRQMQQQRQQTGAVNPVSQASNQMSSHQLAALRAQQSQQAQQQPRNPEQLLRTIQHWAAQQGQQFNSSPVIAGRPINSIQLFMMVMRMGGSKRVTALGNWPNVATFLHFQGQQHMSAAQELQTYWQTSLAGYEHLFGLQQQQRRAMGDPLRGASQGQSQQDSALRQDGFSPTKQMHNQPPQQLMQPPPQMQLPFQTPGKPPINLHQNDPRQQLQNGYFGTQQAQGPGRPSNVYNTPQSIQQTQPHAIIPMEVQRPPARKQSKGADLSHKENPWPRKITEGPEFKPVADSQGGETPRTYGGIELGPKAPFVETVEDLLKYKLSVPKIEELGLIDVRALTLSLRSGIHAEVRLALDTLASLSKDQSSLALSQCDDLIETLIDCADDQIQLLVENSAEVSDEMLINTYEETIRGCKIENATLQEVTAFGTLDHDLDMAVDRLICVTTILRNLSMPSITNQRVSIDNQTLMATSVVVPFIATVIRYIGTRSMLLRTHRNLLDLSKDIVTILANVSQFIDLPGREEALCILHFLLAFAPSPPPNSPEGTTVNFASYVPGVHRYYPHAIDCMAKLLARGDPNRTYYRLIFAADTTSSPPFDLLTRSFGLTIAALPEVGSLNPGSLIKVRLPYLLQGLLAAEILTSLMPISENELARSWLGSQDGFAQSLLKLAIELGQQSPIPPQRHNPNADLDPFGYATITNRSFAVLRKLVEKAKDSGGTSKELPQGVVPNTQSLIAAMQMPTISIHVTRQLCALSSLGT